MHAVDQVETAIAGWVDPGGERICTSTVRAGPRKIKRPGLAGKQGVVAHQGHIVTPVPFAPPEKATVPQIALPIARRLKPDEERIRYGSGTGGITLPIGTASPIIRPGCGRKVAGFGCPGDIGNTS